MGRLLVRRVVSVILAAVLVGGAGMLEAVPVAAAVTTAPMIAAGGDHTVLLKSDGTVWACGDNYNGKLGDGTTTDRNVPVQVNGLSDVIAISAGYNHTVVLKSNGTLWAWGHNGAGQLGDGTTMTRSYPVQVSSLSGVAAVSAGEFYTVALKMDGTVWAWGENYYGVLGDGTTISQTTPVQVTSLSNVTAIAAGNQHTVALKSDGTVWIWGSNGSGLLGDGTTAKQRTTPVQVANLSNVTAISTGLNYTLALKSDGTVWAWGFNNQGRLGDGTTVERITPVQVSNLSNITAISAGNIHAAALKSDGTVWAWGNNNNGQLGDGTKAERTSPVQVTTLSSVTAISAGSAHTLAMKNNGTVWAWGYNPYGVLGDGTTTSQSIPVQIKGENGVGWLNLGENGDNTTPTTGETYTITYNANGGTNAPAAQTKTQGVPLTITNEKPTKDGYYFAGWMETSVAMTNYEFYPPGSTYTVDGNRTLYALWIFEMAYDAALKTTPDYPRAQSLLAFTPPESGYYIFESFGSYDTVGAVGIGFNEEGVASDDNSGEGLNFRIRCYLEAGETYACVHDMKNPSASGSYQVRMYKEEDSATYAITYNANGGTGAPAAQTKIHGQPLTLSNTVPTREGYAFAYWANQDTFGSSTLNPNYKTYRPGDSYTEDKDITLYALWVVDEPDEPVEPTTIELVYNTSTGRRVPETVRWTSDLFGQNPTGSAFPGSSDWHDLAFISAILSTSIENDEPNIQANFKALGLTDTEYKLSSGWNNPAYAFGHRTLKIGNETIDLEVAVFRGTSDEWDVFTDISSVLIDDFAIAANAMKSKFDSFVNAKGGSGNRKIYLITGHSLGGAVANIIAAKFNDDVSMRKNIFAFTFASPKTTIHDFDPQTNTSNFVSCNDIVPYNPPMKIIPPTLYYRFGKEYRVDTPISHAFGAAHLAENYTSYIKTMTGTGETSFDARWAAIQCPVDVEVYKEETLVGRIKDNVVDGSVTTIPAVVNGDDKWVFFPDEQEYKIKLIATDTGTMDYSIFSYNFANEEIQETKTFANVALLSGKNFSTNVGGSIPISNVPLHVVDANGNVIADVGVNGTETPAKQYFNLWGRTTRWEKTPLNWILLIVCFGWLWMR